MNSNHGIVQVLSNDFTDENRRDMMRRICECLQISLEDWALLRTLARRVDTVEGRCASVVNSCASTENILRIACCPANMPFGQLTIDKYSHQNQANIITPVVGLGGDYVDAMPVTPGKKIRLIQTKRPGYSPTAITIALNLANNGTNYLDIAVSFFVTTDPQEQGEMVGSEYRGFQFFNNEGIPTPIKFPLYKNMPVLVGTNEYLVVELHHQGAANNLVSAFAAAHVNNEGWFAACGIQTHGCG